MPTGIILKTIARVKTRKARRLQVRAAAAQSQYRTADLEFREAVQTMPGVGRGTDALKHAEHLGEAAMLYNTRTEAHEAMQEAERQAGAAVYAAKWWANCRMPYLLTWLESTAIWLTLSLTVWPEIQAEGKRAYDEIRAKIVDVSQAK
jgi:hypothetical protein